ncbi:hypothetical protein C5167_031662 [Papaver somniferum]|uniref:Uncharacterized protein n=1 Tax=Papaver somniferum TaxID=3469 RepID=A0A4Y7K4Z3_PAPSO|nr:hypothetical protein C5167_031662 [Papaver somniferum]
MVQRYPGHTTEAIAESFPICRGSCNCKTMIAFWQHDLKSQKMKMEAEERLKYCKYLLQALLPVLNQIHEEQVMEKEIEAKIQCVWLKLKMGLTVESVRDCNRAVVCLPSYTKERDGKCFYRKLRGCNPGSRYAMNMELSSGGNSNIKDELEIIKKQSRGVKNSPKKASNMNCSSIVKEIEKRKYSKGDMDSPEALDELESELEELEGAELEEQILQPATMVIMLQHLQLYHLQFRQFTVDSQKFQLCGGRSFEGFPVGVSPAT